MQLRLKNIKKYKLETFSFQPFERTRYQLFGFRTTFLEGDTFCYVGGHFKYSAGTQRGHKSVTLNTKTL